MSELEEQLMNTAEAETGSAETPTQENAGIETSENQEQPTEEQWKLDKRFGGVWKAPDDVYNSVKFLESKYDPLRQTLEKMGYSDPSQLEQVLGKYPEYEQQSQVLDKLNTLLQHETYGPKLQAALKEVQQGLEREKYGAAIEDLPPHIQEQLRKVNELEEKYNQMQEEKELNANVQTIQTQMDDIQKICEKYGFEIDATAFLKECQQGNVHPNQIKGYFFENNFENLVGTAQSQASMSALNKNSKLKNSAGSSSQRTVPQQEPTLDSIKDLRTELMRT